MGKNPFTNIGKPSHEEYGLTEEEYTTLKRYGMLSQDPKSHSYIEAYYKRYPDASKIVHNFAPTNTYFSFYVEVCSDKELRAIVLEELNKGQTESIERAIELHKEITLGKGDLISHVSDENTVLREQIKTLEAQNLELRQELSKHLDPERLDDTEILIAMIPVFMEHELNVELTGEQVERIKELVGK